MAAGENASVKIEGGVNLDRKIENFHLVLTSSLRPFKINCVV